MKLHKSAKLAVTAGLALSMTMGAAIPAIAQDSARGGVASKAEKATDSPDIKYVVENGISYIECEGRLIQISNSKGKLTKEYLESAKSGLEGLNAGNKLTLVTDKDGNPKTFIALVKVDGYYGLQLGTNPNFIAISKKDGDPEQSYVDAAKGSVAEFLGVSKDDVALNIENGSLVAGKKITVTYYDSKSFNNGGFHRSMSKTIDSPSDWDINKPGTWGYEGYEFAGWTYSYDGNTAVPMSKTIDSPSDWDINKPGTWGYEGYEFAGWTYSYDGNTAVPDGYFDQLFAQGGGQSVVLYGQWKQAEKFTVTFHDVDDNPIPVQVTKGTKLSDAANGVNAKVPEGKRLVGWCFVEDHKVLADDYQIMGDVQLYPVTEDVAPKQAAVRLVVTDPATDKVVFDNTSNYAEGEKVTPGATTWDQIKAAVPEGYELTGWMDSTGKTYAADLSDTVASDGGMYLAVLTKKSVQVTAKFIVTDPETNEILKEISNVYTEGDSMTLWTTTWDELNASVPEGYEITGWTDKDGKTYDADLINVVAGNEDNTFLATLTKKAPEPIEWATATFYDEDGTTVLGTADYQVNEALGFWATTPAPREGYTFKGFAIKGQATAGVVDPATVTMPANGMSFIAVWEKTAPEVQWAKATFLDADGKTVIGTADYQIGKTLDVWAVTPAPRPGYVFKGYYEERHPETIVSPKDVTMSKDGMIFVAVWQKCGPERAQYAPAIFKDHGRTVAVRWYQVGKTLGSWKGAYPDARPGYTFKGYKIAGKDKVVSPKDVTMSKHGMVFEAVWSKKSTPTTPTTPSKPQSPFDDVAYAAWYAKPIAQAKELGYVNGYPGTNLFKPNANITRADAVCILFNMAGGKDMADDLFSKDGGKTFDTGFADVASNAYYAKALAWAKANGVANGYPDTGAFKLDQTITREEFAALLSNYAKLKGEYKAPTTDLSAFKDADTVSNWAKTVVEWGVENKVMGNGGFLAGQSTITRAEVAAMAVNFQPKAVESPVTGK